MTTPGNICVIKNKLIEASFPGKVKRLIPYAAVQENDRPTIDVKNAITVEFQN